jgi:hypothetical protein
LSLRASGSFQNGLSEGKAYQRGKGRRAKSTPKFTPKNRKPIKGKVENEYTLATMKKLKAKMGKSALLM